MFCTKCGKEIDNDAVVCPYCNSATSEAATDVSTQQVVTPQPASNGMGIASIVLGALGIVFGLLIALLGYIFGGAGLALAITARNKNGASTLTTVGMVVSIFTLALSLVNSILGIILALL